MAAKFLLIVLISAITASALYVAKDPVRLEKKQDGALYPVVLVPGLEGSRLEAKLDRKNSVHWYCTKKCDWYTIWLTIADITPGSSDCFQDNFRMFYNKTSRHVYNQEGVEIRPYQFGSTSGIEYLTVDITVKQTIYFKYLVDGLVAKGYTRDVNIRGAPYDFRKSSFDNPEYITNLAGLIEETYRNNSNTPVYLIAHSFGGNYIVPFFDTMTQAWKDKYLKAYIALAIPWAGSVEALGGLTLGDNLDIGFIKQNFFRAMDRTVSSPYSVLPSSVGYPNLTLISYKGANFTLDDYEAIFDLYKIDNAFSMYQNVKDLTVDLNNPGVDTYCIHGNGHDTLETIIYDSDSQFPDSPKLVMGKGDGLVGPASLAACTKWIGQGDHQLIYKVLDGFDHTALLLNQTAIDYIVSIIVQ